MYAVTNLGRSYEISQNFIVPANPRKKTRIMGILNATPDSFSDGGKYFKAVSSDEEESSQKSFRRIKLPDRSEHALSTSGLPKEIYTIISALSAPGRPSSIIDVGGQSTAPGAPEVSAEEEISRVVPVIRAIKSAPITRLISIDTYRASVAKAALDAGADIVNDVSAGTMDPEILKVVAEANCPYILMHMRGTPSTMTKLTSYPDGLIATIASELLTRIAAAEAAGIYRWRIILDPGIGFAKTASQNLEILRDFDKLRTWPGLENFPWLVGSSRKGFIGKVTGEDEPSKRKVGSMVAVVAAIQGGADIVRVHDYRMGKQAVMMGDAIWRGWDPKEKIVKESSEGKTFSAEGGGEDKM